MKRTDRIVLVTGSTQGIGRAIAERLTAGGAGVVLNGRERMKPHVLPSPP